MYTSILLLAVLVPVPLPADEQAYAPPDVELPIPVSTSGPDFFIGGGCWSGGGIRFPDGSVLAATCGSRTSLPDIVYSKPFYETECFRASQFAGTRAGVTSELYLGYGFTARLDLGMPFLARASLDWYPYRGVILTTGLDLLPGRLRAGWMFSP